MAELAVKRWDVPPQSRSWAVHKDDRYSVPLDLSSNYGRPSPPKIQGCQIDQQIQSRSKDQLQDSIDNKGIALPNYGWFSFPS